MIVTSTDNSVVTWLNNDLNGVNGSSRAYVGSATEVYYNYAPGSDTFYYAYQQAAASGAQAYGLTTPAASTGTRSRSSFRLRARCRAFPYWSHVTGATAGSLLSAHLSRRLPGN